MLLKKSKPLTDLVLGMEEPLKKKAKVEEAEAGTSLVTLQQHLLTQCLCAMPESVLEVSLRGFYTPSMTAPVPNRERTLMLASTVQMISELAIKQNSRGYVCARLADVCNVLTRDECGLVDYLIGLADERDSFIGFAAGRALAAFFVVMKSHVHQRWLDRLTEQVVHSQTARNASFALGVLRRVVEWKDVDEHTLEEEDEEKTPASCRALSILEEQADSAPVKCMCIKALEVRWTAVVERFDALITANDVDYQSTIIAFLNLWEAIISVKANLSVVDTKPFYSDLNRFVSLLTASTSSIIWKHILDLFNEVLCYGSTLALQDILAEEPCSLAHLIVRGVKDWHLLSMVPYRDGSDRFGGGCVGSGDKVLLKKVVLLVLKSVAVTVKEMRCDSSSDSSLGSEAEDANADMAVIERSIREVLRQLDTCVKGFMPFHPETKLAQWVVQLFTDQDDALVESMVCCLDVSVGLCYRDNALQDLRDSLNPTVAFLQFLQVLSFNADVLLDFLVSNETCFLLYILRFPKYVYRNWDEFVHTCGHQLADAMNVLLRLRLSVERLVAKNLFPYNINPVLKLLKKCEQLYGYTLNP